MSEAPCPHDDQQSASECERCAKELLFAAVLDSSDDGIVIFDSAHQARFWNESAVDLLGLNPFEFSTHPTIVQLGTRDLDNEFLVALSANNSETNQTGRLNSSSKIRQFSQRVEIAGLPWRMVRLKPDDSRGFTDELYALAHTDELSGLLNRRGFQTKLERSLGQPICVAIVDIDFFKKTNDEFGHEAGDQAIRWIAERLESQFDDAVCVARLGGDEFGVVLNVKSDVADLLTNSTDNPSAIERRFIECCSMVATSSQTWSRNTSGMTISIGVAIAGIAGLPARSLLSAADAAMYRSKNEGRNQVTFVVVE